MSVLVHWKSAHTDQYLNYNSHYHTSYKNLYLVEHIPSLSIKIIWLNRENTRIEEVLMENQCQENTATKVSKSRPVTEVH